MNQEPNRQKETAAETESSMLIRLTAKTAALAALIVPAVTLVGSTAVMLFGKNRKKGK